MNKNQTRSSRLHRWSTTFFFIPLFSWACQFFNDNYDFGQVFAGNDYVTQLEWCNGTIQLKTEADILNQILNKEKQILTEQLKI